MRKQKSPEKEDEVKSHSTVSSDEDKDKIDDLMLEEINEKQLDSSTVQGEDKHLTDKLPLKSKVILGPVDRYFYYGTFPWKFTVHLLIVLVCSQIAFLKSEQSTILFVPQMKALYKMFLNDDLDDFNQLKDSYTKMLTFYSVDDLNEHVAKSVNTFFDLHDPETNKYFASLNTTSSLLEDFNETPKLFLQYKASAFEEQIAQNITNLVQNLTPDDLGPFNNSEQQKTKDMLKLVDQFFINYTIFTNYSNFYAQHFNYWQWEIRQIFDTSMPSLITMTLSIRKQDLDTGKSEWQSFLDSIYYQSMQYLLLLFSIISLLLNINHYIGLKETFKSISQKYSQRDNLNFIEKDAQLQSMVETGNKRKSLVDRLTGIREQNQEYKLIALNNSQASNQSHKDIVNKLSNSNYRQSQIQSSQDQLLAFSQAFESKIKSKIAETTEAKRGQSAIAELFKQNVKQLLVQKQEQIDEKANEKNKEQLEEIFNPEAVKSMSTWDSLPLQQKLQLIDFWSVVIILGNLFHILGVCSDQLPQFNTFQFQTLNEFLFGMGTAIMWLALTMYIQFDEQLNDLPATVLNTALPILRQIISTVPIVVGISYFGMAYFGMSWRFNQLDKSCVMLWALWNGDEPQNMYHYLTPISALMGPVFCYAWIWFSNNCIQNAFLAMVEDGYVRASRTSMFAWIKDDLQDPDQNKVAYDSDDEPMLTSEQFLESIKQRQLIQTELLYDHENYQYKKFQIQDMLNLEEQSTQAKKIQSKRTLQILLKIDEIEWNGSEVEKQQKQMISSRIARLIDIKLEFNNLHMIEVTDSIKTIYEVSAEAQHKLRDLKQERKKETKQAGLFNPGEFALDLEWERKLGKAFKIVNSQTANILESFEEIVDEAYKFEAELEQDMLQINQL